MTEWELARYLIDAKKDIDTILFIKLYFDKISNLNLKEKISKIQMDFYIKLCVILDEIINKKEKKNICEANKIINDIYYERDKDKAHKDKNYMKKDSSSFNEIIRYMKMQINEVRIIANDKLPASLTLDYVPHDKELFRFVFGITKDKEEEINKKKYSSEEIKGSQSIVKKVFSDTEDIKYIPEERRKEYAVIMKNGINFFEGIQERQDGCININVLYQLNCWCEFEEKSINKWINLKKNGFIDKFDIPCNIIIWSNEKWKEFYNIVNGEE